MSRFFLLVALSLGLSLPVVAAPASLPVTPVSSPSGLETIGLSGLLPNFETVQIDSSHVYDYTFASAPTDWWMQSGVWEMTNRWSCSPGWSWFGGRSDETAAIWNKRKFSGDVSVQFYFAFKMGLSGAVTWPEYCSDAAVTIAGDGKNLSSGYTLIIGADANSRSVLRKGSRIVAESSKPEALLPNVIDGRPADNRNEIHRRWWYVRIDKIGSRVLCYLDNKLLFSYDDPKPLEAGKVALWTYNNGIMLSRVQIYYQSEVRPLLVRRPDGKKSDWVVSASTGKAAIKSAQSSTIQQTSPATKYAAFSQ
jgi:hypothetical protein